MMHVTDDLRVVMPWRFQVRTREAACAHLTTLLAEREWARRMGYGKHELARIDRKIDVMLAMEHCLNDPHLIVRPIGEGR